MGTITEAISPLVDFAYHEEIRNLCARILPKLFELLVNGLRDGQTNPQQCLEFYNSSVKTLIDQYLSEDAATERSCIAESLRDIFCVGACPALHNRLAMRAGKRITTCSLDS